jgi:hypothetical protein
LLAEQGVFGAAAIVALVAIALTAFRRASPGYGRMFVAAFVGWSFSEMTHAAMRLVLVSFAIGLAVAASGLEEPTGVSTTHRPSKIP